MDALQYARPGPSTSLAIDCARSPSAEEPMLPIIAVVSHSVSFHCEYASWLLECQATLRFSKNMVPMLLNHS